MAKSPELTEKQLKFAELYAISNNGTEAAIGAGYTYANTAIGKQNLSKQVNRLTTDARVLALIQVHRDALAKGTEITPEAIINALDRIATTNIEDIVTWSTDSDGNMVPRLKDSADIENPGRYISKVTIETGRTSKPVFKVELVSKETQIQAMAIMARIKGMYQDKIDINQATQVNVILDSELLKGESTSSDPIVSNSNSEPEE